MLYELEIAVNKLIHKLYPSASNIVIQFERPKSADMGDLSLSTAMVLAKQLKKSPRDIANEISTQLKLINEFDRVEIAGPGFLNFFLKHEVLTAFIQKILNNNESLYREYNEIPQSVYMEFVSANPTGPLHVGHGRSAVIGSALARILKKSNYSVHCDYYVNDAGTQIDTLACSVILRYVQSQTPELNYPTTCYQGEYITEIASELNTEILPQAVSSIVEHESKWSSLEDTEAQRTLITIIKSLIPDSTYKLIKERAVSYIIDLIRTDLDHINIHYDQWFLESDLIKNDAVKHCYTQLKANNTIYEKDGAQWFTSSQFNDEKDRVIIRSNHEHTYFFNDIAYHHQKYLKADKVINVIGSDHHGYGPRLEAAKNALGFKDKELIMRYCQFAILLRGKEKVSMSTRSGQYITLHQLIDEVGPGPTVFFYALKKPDQHLEFDIELAKKQSSDNPYYYVQYAHARICQLISKAQNVKSQEMTLLSHPTERQIMNQIYQFDTFISRASRDLSPHYVCFYLMDLAKLVHQYYNDVNILKDSDLKRLSARINLLECTKITLKEGLSLLGIEPKERM
tara:strand:+ start:19165 stop:20871 length:1707 start_codon:yes stop_codon:yes gene_type:complete